MDIKYGAEVLDKSGKALGVVDYLIRNTYTGEISKFKVKTGLAEADLFFSPADVLEAAPSQIKLKATFDEGRGKA
jgi:sporulation protein YlmC with PRC-barrel domain